jgi:hypothetical protein
MPSARQQVFYLLMLAIPVTTIAWTVVHEEIFREPRNWCKRKSETSRSGLQRKFFYLFTCEYCFSFYVAAGALLITRFHLLYPDWRGYLVSWLSLVWVANMYMSFYGRIRLDIKRERVEIARAEPATAKR